MTAFSSVFQKKILLAMQPFITTSIKYHFSKAEETISKNPGRKEEETSSGAHKRKSWFSELMKGRKRQLSI
jgi:hypothetical protein